MVTVVVVSSSIPLSISTLIGTVNSFGENAEHKMITWLDFQRPPEDKYNGIFFATEQLNNLAGNHGKSGTIGSPDNLSITFFLAHCDNAYFEDDLSTSRLYCSSQKSVPLGCCGCKCSSASVLKRASSKVVHCYWTFYTSDIVPFYSSHNWGYSAPFLN